jgi:hypothetical protein
MKGAVTKAAPMSSTDHGGGKRRLGIGFTKVRFSDGGHRTNDRVAGLCMAEKFGEISHEDAASGCRLRDRNGFCHSSFRSSMPEWHVAKRSLHLRQL